MTWVEQRKRNGGNAISDLDGVRIDNQCVAWMDHNRRMVMKPNCIICIYDYGYEIVWPFASEKELIAYIDLWESREVRTRRWQSLYLADPYVKPNVFNPSHAVKIATR